MKKLVFLLLMFVSVTACYAGHIAGGEIYYRYLGAGGGANTFRYEITLRLFRECNPPAGNVGTQIAPMPLNVTIGIFNNASPFAIVTSNDVARNIIQEVNLTQPGPCITNAPQVCYQVGYYTYTTDLPASASGYVLSFQTCCRTNGINNISGNSIGATYTAEIPPTAGIGAINNSSAVFALKDTTLVCQNLQFTLDFSASDTDNDSLVYSFCAAYNGGAALDASPRVPSNPIYGNISYAPFASGAQPLGPEVSINPNTGIISGTAPSAGSYVINVCVAEYRRGRLLTIHRKDFTLKIGNCSITEARLPQPGYPTLCKSNSFTFENLSSSSNITSYSWQFFDPRSGKDTSSSPTPTHTYSDTGVYKVKLTVTSQSGCVDSSTSLVYVFPGFNANFNINGSCILNPYNFTDQTNAVYGVVNKWRWEFGDQFTTADSSILKNPAYRYNALGQYPVRLIASSSRGCTDTTTKVINVLDRPFLRLPFTDTLICSIDTLSLRAEGTGVFSWTPGYNIIQSNSANPLVYPKITTEYVVTLNDNGCTTRDTVKVNVLDFITVNAGNDTSICRGDIVNLQPVTQGLQFSWSPGNGLSNPLTRNPLANITTTTSYLLSVNLGNCQAKDSVTIKVVPYPSAVALGDTAICFGSSTQLSATISASSFAWSPATSLQNSRSLTPVADPTVTTNYILTVFDTLGCPKPGYDTVVVRVVPRVRAFAGADTVVAANQPLQLNATGGTVYRWSPAFGLNNPNINNPIATLGPEIGTIRYVVQVGVPEGCATTDDINVRVFKTGPDLFIPTAFSPNNDGKNDILKPIAVGLRSLEFFRVYNRWGQLVYTTSEIGKGWNGKLAGVDQASGTFVFYAQAIDYLGNPVIKKGTVVLIR